MQWSGSAARIKACRVPQSAVTHACVYLRPRAGSWGGKAAAHSKPRRLPHQGDHLEEPSCTMALAG